MNTAGKVDIGKKRKSNQDAIFVSDTPIGVLPNLYIVADGMGGYNAGDVASNLAIEAFCMYIREHTGQKIIREYDLLLLLKMGVAHANHKVYEKSRTDEAFSGMGTTLTLCTVINQKAYIAHVGDSRLYGVTADEIIQVTTDHSYVQEMVEKGLVMPEEASTHSCRHVITRAIGTYESVKVDTVIYDLKSCEYLLICSDGLTTMLSDDEILEETQKTSTQEEKATALITCANQKGGLDNIAVILRKTSEVRKSC